jgi:hypothetical protein
VAFAKAVVDCDFLKSSFEKVVVPKASLVRELWLLKH